jgi:hypothetical protein
LRISRLLFLLEGAQLEAHGGYLCRFEDVDVAWLSHIASEAWTEDGRALDDMGLLVTVLSGPRVMRFAYDGPQTYGRSGARWYSTHHALARRLSSHLRETVHAYVYDPHDMEQVVSWGGGRRVGGELLRYEDVDVPDDDDEPSFDKMKSKWPLGHLAQILGVARQELVELPREQTALLTLGEPKEAGPLWRLFPQALSARPRPVLTGT